MIKKFDVLMILFLFILAGCTAKEETVDITSYEVNTSAVLSSVIETNSSKEVNLDEYYNELQNIADSDSVLGMQVAVFKDGEIINTYSYGYTDLSKDIPVDDDTVFRIASTSKTISNIAVMKLVEEGKINLTDSVYEATGLDFDEDVKLWNILTHTSGYGDSELYESDFEHYIDINTLIDSANRGSAPGSVFEYSNFVAGTMAAIVERISGEYFSDYTEENMFEPLNMNASYLYENLNEGTVVAKMHYDGSATEYDPSTWDYDAELYSSFGLGNQYRLAHGNLMTSAKDLAKIGIVLAGDGTYNGTRILNQSTLDLIRYYRVNTGDVYGMGLNTDIFNGTMVSGRKLYGHTGYAYGAVTALLYDPSDNSGVVILTNHATSEKEKGVRVVIRDVSSCVYKYFFS